MKLGYENKTIITYGTFDTFHFGHWNILRRASLLGNRLIVGVSSDEFNEIKNKKSFHSFKKRKEIIETLNFVDLVIKEDSWEQKRQDIIDNNVDIFVMGDDWVGEFDYLSDICEVQYLQRTKHISSTQMKKILD
ncbi:MAG: adenylyltransferase/cytidyltransferase family protein [Candidatus Gastranaerophilales bacterium]